MQAPRTRGATKDTVGTVAAAAVADGSPVDGRQVVGEEGAAHGTGTQVGASADRTTRVGIGDIATAGVAGDC